MYKDDRDWWLIPVAERVKHGVELLDEQVPDWRSKIRTSYLDMQSLDYCILGQLYGTYGTGTDLLDINGCYYGFDGVWSEQEDPPNGDLTEQYAELAKLWLAELG